MRIRWLRAAVANLSAEADYVSRDSPSAALKVVAKVTQSVRQLEKYPVIGRPGRVPGTRELVVSGTPYIVPYRVRDNTVEVLRVFHGARRWPQHF